MTRLAFFVVLVLAGCASYRGIEPRSQPVAPAALAADKSLGAESASGEWPALDWWQRYGDPQLDALIGEALAGSPNMRLAQARLDQARAQAQVAGATLRPQVNAGASVNRQRFSENYIFPPPIGGSSYTTTQLDLNASYDVDFWGRNRAAYEAAVGRARAAEAESFAARLVL
jgi:outer membrane protein TolC